MSSFWKGLKERWNCLRGRHWWMSQIGYPIYGRQCLNCARYEEIDLSTDEGWVCRNDLVPRQ